MINKYYQRELAKLRELGSEFARIHPALAPLLTGHSSDPDVERILEGTAFLTGLLHQRLEDDFPEIIQSLFQLLYPHYLRPLPSATMIHFKSKASLREKIKVPAGTSLASIQLDEGKCTFTTSSDFDLTPLDIAQASLQITSDHRSVLSLKIASGGVPINQLQLDSLRIFLAGDINIALLRYYFIFTKLKEIRLKSGSNRQPGLLSPSHLKPVSFGDNEALLPFPERSFPGYRLLQEYFILPEKFLFLDVVGLGSWIGQETGKEFTLEFVFNGIPTDEMVIKKENFLLHVVPALNIFPQDADPIILDHRQPDYRIQVSGGHQKYQVHSVLSVHGLVHNTMDTVEYLPFEMFNPQSQARPVYTLRHEQSPLDGSAVLALTVAYPPTLSVNAETLSIKTLCTNGILPASLRAGDISMPTDSSPALAEFTNLMAPTAPSSPPLGHNLLWRLLSHLFLNYLSVANADNLRAMLKLYVFSNTRDKAQAVANTKRVEAILDLKIEKCQRFLKGYLHRGRDLHITLDPKGFAGQGDMYLFGSMLDNFLAGYAGVNTFTRLTVIDSIAKDQFTWPEKLGDKLL